jgi:hypothetical protein
MIFDTKTRKEGIGNMRTTYRRGFAILATLSSVMVLVAGAADVDQPAQSLTASLLADSTLSVDTEDNVTVFSFTPMSNYRINSQAEALPSSGFSAFVGDYADDGIEAVVFEIQSDGHALYECKVQLFSSDDTSFAWSSQQQITTAAGEWDRKIVGFDRIADGWDKGVLNPDEAFSAAVANVHTLGFRLAPQDPMVAQTYKIRNFMLVTKLGKVLFGPYGVTQVSEVGDQGSGDADEDGMTDLEEDLVGTDKTLADSVFVVEVLGTTDDGVTVKWASAVEWATYKIFRTDDLVAGFGAEPVAQVDYDQVAHPAAGQSVWEDTTLADPNAGPYHYRVVCVIP